MGKLEKIQFLNQRRLYGTCMGELSHGGLFCNLDGVVRGGKGFPNQVGYLNIGFIPSFQHSYITPTIISTPKTTSHLENSHPWGLSLLFATKAGFFSSIKRMY